MIDYDTATDFEIDEAVAIASGQRYAVKNETPSFKRLVNTATMPAQPLSYCNSPDDMWPIILENKIDSTYSRAADWWTCRAFDDQLNCIARHCHENPLRAAAIVYLKMMEAEK